MPNMYMAFMIAHGPDLHLDKCRFKRWNFAINAQNSGTKMRIDGCEFEKIGVILGVCLNSSAHVTKSIFHYVDPVGPRYENTGILYMFHNDEGNVVLKGNTMKTGQRPRYEKNKTDRQITMHSLFLMTMAKNLIAHAPILE